MIQKLVAPLSLALVLGSSSGCATILSDNDRTVAFMSEPSGADVMVASLDRQVFTRLKTPESSNLETTHRYIASFSKEGYHTITVPLVAGAGTDTATSAFLNFFMGGIIFGPVLMTVDAASGAALSLPKTVKIQLTSLEKPKPPSAKTFEEVLEIYDDLRAQKAAVSRPVPNSKTRKRSSGAGRVSMTELMKAANLSEPPPAPSSAESSTSAKDPGASTEDRCTAMQRRRRACK